MDARSHHPQQRTAHPSLLAGGMGCVWAIAAAKLLLHMTVACRYAFFGDELYHLACGEHLA